MAAYPQAGDREGSAGAENSLNDVLEAVEAGVFAVDHQGVITAVNPGAQRLPARSAKDLLGRDAHDFLYRDAQGKPQDRAGCPVLRAMPAGRTAPEQAGWLEGGDGSVLPVSWLVTPFRRRDETTGELVVFHQRSAAEADREQGLAAASLSELERLALLAETTSRDRPAANDDDVALLALRVPAHQDTTRHG